MISYKTSSIGSIEMDFASYNRAKGFAPPIEKESDIDKSSSKAIKDAKKFLSYDEISRVSIRTIIFDTNLLPLVIDSFTSKGFNFEGVITSVDRDAIIAYFGINKPERYPPKEELDIIRRNIEDGRRFVNFSYMPTDGEYEFFTNRNLPDNLRSSAKILLKDAFGWNLDEAESILKSNNTYIGILTKSNNAVAISAIEKVAITLNNLKITLLELTEAYVVPSERGKGLYFHLSLNLLSSLIHEVSNDYLFIYGESNLRNRGITRVVFSQKRLLSIDLLRNLDHYIVRDNDIPVLASHVPIKDEYSDRFKYNSLVPTSIDRKALDKLIRSSLTRKN